MQQRTLGLVLGVAVALWSWPAAGADIALTAGKIAKLKDKSGTASDKASVKFVKEGALSATLPDPRCPAVSTVRLKTNGDDVLATLDCNLWTVAGSGYGYDDPGASHGGVQKIKFKTKITGGGLLIKIAGAQYGVNAIGGPITFLETQFAVGATSYCGRFEAPTSFFKKNVADQIIIKGPSSACIPPTPTATSTATFTPTPTNTPTATFTLTSTRTRTATATATGTGTNTFTATITHTATPTVTPSNTVPPGSTATSTGTVTETGTPTLTPTPSATVTLTPTASPSPTPIPPSVFRIDSIALRDPHVFVVPIIGCSDVTNPPGVFGFSVNDQISMQVNGDSEPDGMLDLSLVALFEPLTQPPNAGTLLEIRTADCTTPVGSEICTPDMNPGSATPYINQSSGTCLNLLPGTSGPNNGGSYSPAITLSTGPCFHTDPVTITFPFGLFTVPLQNVQGSGKYVGNPANQLIDGMLVGFLNESDANAILLPSDLPVVGGQPLSKFLPGGSGCCATHTAKDVGPMGQPGWYFYLNYTAHLVTWTG